MLEANVLDKVCEALGVEVNEVWQSTEGDYYKINENGELLYKIGWMGEDAEWDEENEVGYALLLTGQTKPRRKPKIGENYYTPGIYFESCYEEHRWENDDIENLWYHRGLIFYTKEEAIEQCLKMLEI